MAEGLHPMEKTMKNNFFSNTARLAIAAAFVLTLAACDKRHEHNGGNGNPNTLPSEHDSISLSAEPNIQPAVEPVEETAEVAVGDATEAELAGEAPAETDAEETPDSE